MPAPLSLASLIVFVVLLCCKACKLIQYEDDGSALMETLGEIPICMTWGQNAAKHLPGVKFDDLVAEKDADDTEADAPVNNLHANDENRGLMDTIAVGDAKQVEQSMYTKYSGSTFSEVLREFGLTPKMFDISPSVFYTAKGREVIYACERDEKFEKKYPTVKIGCSSNIAVTTRNADRGSRALFPSQGQAMLSAAGSGTVSAGKDVEGPAVQHMRLSIKTNEQLTELSEKLKDAKARKATSRLEAKGTTDLLEVDDGMDSDVEGMMGGVGSDGNAWKGPSPVAIADHVEGWSKGECADLDFDRAFDGSKLGQLLNHAAPLMPKNDAAERSQLTRRMDLAKVAVPMNCDNCHQLKDEELISKVNELAKAGAKPTLKLRVALTKRHTNNTFAKIEQMTELSEIKAELVDYLSHICMWNASAKRVLDEGCAPKPPLRHTGLVDQQPAQVFRDPAIKHMLLKFACAGHQHAVHVRTFIQAATEARGNLPEEAGLRDRCALELTSSNTVISLLALLQSDSAFDVVTAEPEVIELLQTARVKAAELSLDQCSITMTAAAVATCKHWNDSSATGLSWKIAERLGSFKQLFRDVGELDPMNDSLTRISTDIGKALADLDLSAKHAVLDARITNWSFSAEASTTALKEAIAACDGRRLPEGRTTLAYEKCMEIVEHVSKSMRGDSAKEFQVVDVHTTRDSGEDHYSETEQKVAKLAPLLQYAGATLKQLNALRSQAPGAMPEDTDATPSIESTSVAACGELFGDIKVIDEFVDLYEKSLKTADTQFIETSSDQISDLVGKSVGTTNKYSLSGEGDYVDEMRTKLAEARAMRATDMIMEFLATPSAMKDKVAMQRKAQAAAQKLKRWRVDPSTMDAVVVARYKQALKYK
ncbi:unnamed protein product [Prorocentrum cordatum]|uniref:Cytochrome c domain-containing protein n=1 Tax=Prorocentrum cordatum TaxID=2364126 RepID=A0ABN9Q607_9DINO|nr:unnamed protein product [Polarella glacialis]